MTARAIGFVCGLLLIGAGLLFFRCLLGHTSDPRLMPGLPQCKLVFQIRNPDARAQLAKNRKDFDARLQAVSLAAARDCRGLSADWVRLYNEALGLAGAGGGPGGEGADPAGDAASAGQAGPAGAGVRGDALATPEDVLAHVRDYGGYCRGLEAQAKALVKVAQ